MSRILFSDRSLFRGLALLLVLAGLVSLSTPVTAATNHVAVADANIREFHLVAEGSGWLLMGQQLYWTDDNGLHWDNITPDATNVLDVSFLNAEQGWVILSQNEPSQFTLASTTSRGRDWTFTDHDFSELAQLPSGVSNVFMGWRDPLQGWLVFKLAAGSNFSNGLLYTTQDGGASWHMHNIPIGEPTTFIDEMNGWVAGGPAGKLYHTQDGGVSWQDESLDADTHYQLPVFVDDLNGTLPVITADALTHVEFLQTDDTGQTWNSAGVIALEADSSSDISLPLSITDATHSTLLIPNSDRIIHLTDAQILETQNTDGQSANIVALDMISAQSGWGQWVVGMCGDSRSLENGKACTSQIKLLSTRDGGLTWNAIPLPGTGQTSILKAFISSGSSVNSLTSPDPDTQAYVGQGFDKCEVPTLTQMQKWWMNSPYNAVNVYIGGSARGCDNIALTASFVSQLNTQGWRFIPTWVGPQASCSGYASRMSSDPVVAYQQGVAEADLAVDTAIALGLAEPDGSGTIIYYDLEAYSTSNVPCRSAANEFISGWVSQMRARGNLGGVYGASCASAVSDWAAIANVPDALWIANWYGNAGTVSYDPSASVFGTYCISDTLWSNHERLRQYAGGHNETWGGITLGIDSNAIDGPLTVRNGTGGVSAASQPVHQGPVLGTTLSRTNDTWLTWKTTGDSCSVHIWGGSIDTTVSDGCSFYHLGVRPGGTYSWQVTSTNSMGSTTGEVWQFKVKPYAPSSLAVSTVTSTKINLSWQLSTDDPSNVDGYNIYQDGTKAASVNKSVASYQSTNLACNSSHTFYVTSIRQGVESNAGNVTTGTTATCAPSLINPANGLVLGDRRPGFEWQVVDVATSYNIQVSQREDFSIPALEMQLSATSYLMPTDLMANSTYYWRVRSVGPFGYGDWSAARSFKTANPPSVPGFNGPLNGGLIANYAPKLNWTDSILPSGTSLDQYQVQLASDSTFSTILHDESALLSEFVVPVDLAPDSNYYWRVRAVNTLGQYSNWSATWWFRTAISAPTLNAPLDASSLDHIRPALDWSDVDGATRYTFQLSRYSNFSVVMLSRSVSASQYTFTTDLPRNTLLYWRVRTEAVNGPSQWSGAQSFHTGNPSSIPVLLTPTVNALIRNYQPRLDWYNVVLPTGVTLDHYEIQLATDAAFTSITSDTSVVPSQYIPATPLDANTKYYWRVRAFTTVGHYSAWSVVRYFRTVMVAPAAIAPAHDSLTSELHPSFSWDPVVGVTFYTIQFSRFANFSNIILSSYVWDSAYTPQVNLPKGVVIYWRVRANGPNGPSPWSPAFRLTIQ